VLALGSRVTLASGSVLFARAEADSVFLIERADHPHAPDADRRPRGGRLVDERLPARLSDGPA